MLTAMLVVLVAIFFAVLVLVTWIDTRVRPPPPPADVGEPPRTVPKAASPPVVARPAAPTDAESPDLRRARLQCEAGKQRSRIELAKLGNRRMAADQRLWGDYAARECAAYTATAKPRR